MQGIEFYNRNTSRIEGEHIYGESYLRWLYASALGRIALWALVRRAVFSRWYGWRMNRASSRERVEPFVRDFGVDMDDYRDEVSSFKSFNEFFYRHLRPGARPIVEAASSVALPADGRHLGIPNLSATERIYAKGQSFALARFLGDDGLADRFARGTGLISRLCPVDYHRFHSPVAGTIVSQRLVNGDLFSVSPIALVRNISYLWENKRLVTLIDSPEYGTVAFVAIGATCVGSIEMTRKVGASVAKGEELGYFAFGGSCVTTLFEENRVSLADDIATHSAKSVEVYALMGQLAGNRIS